MTLRIQLLGPPQVSRDGRQLEVPGYRPLALLAYLLLAGKPQSREHLVYLLFDRPDDPRAALRWTLSQLRKAIGSEVLQADRQEIGFDFDSDYWLDVAAFEEGELDLYRGELLEGLYLRDARQYEAWLLVERERLRANYQAGLEERLHHAQEAEDVEGVEKTALQLLQLDNLREDWHQALISAYARQGKFEAAQAQYELCRTILQDELGKEPTPATVTLAEEIEQEQADLYDLLAEHSDSSLSIAGALAGSRAGRDQGRRWPRRRVAFMGVFLLILLALVVGLSLGGIPEAAWGAAGDSDAREPAFSREYAGTTVTLAGSWGEPIKEQLVESVEPFEQETGIEIEVINLDVEFEEVLPRLVETDLAPDLAAFPQPGFLADFVRQGEIVDVRTFLDEEYLEQQYGRPLVEASIVEEQIAGVWTTTIIKSLVWYPKEAFDTAGYEVPQTWEELMALSDQIVADGRTPWCIGIESGAASGWSGTDWVEDILLRTAPPETYDAWVAGELPFDSPEIRRVFAIMADIWHNEAYVYGGTENILLATPAHNALHMFEQPPACYLAVSGSYILGLILGEVEGAAENDELYDFFYLPPIDPAYGRPVLGSGDIVAMFNDRPEVREVMRYLTTPDAVRYVVQSGFHIAPHRDTPFEWYQSRAQLKMAQVLLEADTYRFDGSDMMPPEVGVGTFWQGIVDWVRGEDLGAILQEIDASWPQEGEEG